MIQAVTRATGIVAAVLVVAALVWGALFSARATGDRLRPAWWLDLHNWLGGLSLVFTGVHVLAAWLDSIVGLSLPQVFIPGLAGPGWSVSSGIIAMYLLALVVFTTWPKRWRKRFWWRFTHLTSVVATGLVLLHGYLIGSDSLRFDFRAGIVLAAAISTYVVALRLFGAMGSAVRRPAERLS